MAPREPISSAGRSPDEGWRETPRVAIIDSDSGFLLVLAKRLQRLAWQHRMLALNISVPKLVALELDVLVVDLASLGGRRWDWLQRLCEAEPSFGVIVCTGSSTTGQRVRGLRLGVDDWLSKPCHPEELIARVEAVAGRVRQAEPRSLEPVMVGEVEIRPDRYQAFVRGTSLELTRREYQLIELLSLADGEILDRELIYQRLWGYAMARNDRSVDVFVHKLRRKLKLASPGWSYVQTKPRVGYRLAAEPEQQLLSPPPVALHHECEQAPVPLAA